MTGQDVTSYVSCWVIDDLADLLDGQAVPAQLRDLPGASGLAATVPAVAGRGVDRGRRQQADLVVVPQRADGQACQPGEPPDGHQLIVVHGTTIGPPVARESTLTWRPPGRQVSGTLRLQSPEGQAGHSPSGIPRSRRAAFRNPAHKVHRFQALLSPGSGELKSVGGLVRHPQDLGPVTDAEEFLLAYDRQLRTDAETPSAIAVSRVGPLRLVTFAGGRGFVTYPHIDSTDARDLPHLVPQVRDHYRADPAITRVEWKTRAHDRIPGLRQALADNGFEPGEPESIMIGRAQLLDVDVPLPAGVTLRRISDDNDVRAMATMQAAVFSSVNADETARALLSRLELGDGTELWVAEAQGQIVSAGRLEPVAGTDFAGIWGGATLTAWRGHGIYRALTAARARSALAAGKNLIHSDSTEYSRPILERSGFVKVSSTTPYLWRR
jgi:hypothetical protein